MLGSLDQFLSTNIQQCFPTKQKLKRQKKFHPTEGIKNYKSSMSQYIVEDKSFILNQFNKNHQEVTKRKLVFSVNSKDPNSIYPKKYPYQHTSFFVKPEITKDYIAKQGLKRKHNLLRAIVRSNNAEVKSKSISHHDQSFRKLAEGYQQIYAQPTLRIGNIQKDHIQLDFGIKKNFKKLQMKKSLQKCQKIIEDQRCLSWAKKHNKDYSHYEKALGKNHQRGKSEQKVERKHFLSEISECIKNMKQ